MDDTNTNHYKLRKKLGTNKAFTLVELIIVITILAILATIAFISFQGYNKNARDGNRLGNLKTIETGLDLYSVKTGVYPEPEGTISTGSITTNDGEQILVKKGIIGDNTASVVRLNTTPKDPLSLTNYVYATTSDNREYQIGTVLETGVSYLPLVENTYADNGYQAKVLGNYKGYITFNSGGSLYIANIPSLLWSGENSINLLQTGGTNTPKYIINNGKNLPYHPSKGYISSDELGTENPIQVIQEKTQNTNATLISISKTELEQIVKELKINENYEISQELKNSLGIESTQDIIKSFGANTSEDFDRVILGNKNTTSGKIIPKTAGVCGDASTAYAHNITTFSGGENKFCDVGTLEGSQPIFPTQGNSVSWMCISPDGGDSAECSASRANPDEEVKACSGKPNNSKYFNGTDDYSVTIPFGTQAPASIYSVTPTENSCEYSCVTGYTMNSGRCNDLTPPTGGSFNINEGATTIDVTDVTLNITCATDVIDGTDIQVAFGNTATPTNWQNCSGSKSLVHTVTTGDGVKTVYVRFRDSAGNMSTAISQTITYEEALYYFTTHTFTNCGMTGNTGPTLVACRSSYATSWSGNDNFFNQAHAQGIQLWTVPKTGRYSIDAYGAQGGNGTSSYIGGLGARMKGDFYLIRGEKIQILVGQRGGDNASYKSGGGGGGTFVTDSSNTPLVVSGGGGGGGGNSSPRSGQPGLIGTSGGDGSQGIAIGGTNGNGGAAANGGGGGAGLIGNGFNGYISNGGMSFTNGGVGGQKGICTASTGGGDGGFGGGGGGEWCQMGATGGGGGYSGGASTSSNGVAGGGGSFIKTLYRGNTVTNTISTEGARSGHGQVIITALN